MLTVIWMISCLGIASAVLCVFCLRSSALCNQAAERFLISKGEPLY